MTWKLLTNNEMHAIIDQIPNADAELLERLYDVLRADVLRRADDEQREKIYNTFTRWYKIKCRLENRPVKKDILNRDKWINPGEPYYVSANEMSYIKRTIDGIADIDKLNDYFDFIKNNVYSRATPKQVEVLGNMFLIRKRQIEFMERRRKEINEMMNSEEYKNRPEIGTEVSMKINGEVLHGVVVNRAYTTPDVEVQWDTGERSWINPKHLKPLQD